MLNAGLILKDYEGEAIDEVILDFDDRHRRRITLTGVKGLSFLLDLPEVPDIRDGDALLLSDGSRVLVRAAPEALMEIVAIDPLHLARIAWHLGNRHLAAEIGEEAIRIRADHVIADMARGLGGVVRDISAPFNPEPGAYAQKIIGHSHGHGHHHDHDDHHGHHHHGHSHDHK